METETSNKNAIRRKDEHTTATFIHLSTFLKYFFPFANYIAPVLIWTFNKEKPFVDDHGRQAINFQLSMLVYSLILGLGILGLAIVFGADFIHLIDSIDRYGGEISPRNLQNIWVFILLFGTAIVLFLVMFVFELYAVINASIHASKGLLYKYPLSISFLKTAEK